MENKTPASQSSKGNTSTKAVTPESKSERAVQLSVPSHIVDKSPERRIRWIPKHDYSPPTAPEGRTVVPPNTTESRYRPTPKQEPAPSSNLMRRSRDAGKVPLVRKKIKKKPRPPGPTFLVIKNRTGNNPPPAPDAAKPPPPPPPPKKQTPEPPKILPPSKNEKQISKPSKATDPEPILVVIKPRKPKPVQKKPSLQPKKNVPEPKEITPEPEEKQEPDPPEPPAEKEPPILWSLFGMPAPKTKPIAEREPEYVFPKRHADPLLLVVKPRHKHEEKETEPSPEPPKEPEPPPPPPPPKKEPEPEPVKPTPPPPPPEKEPEPVMPPPPPPPPKKKKMKKKKHKHVEPPPKKKEESKPVEPPPKEKDKPKPVEPPPKKKEEPKPVEPPPKEKDKPKPVEPPPEEPKPVEPRPEKPKPVEPPPVPPKKMKKKHESVEPPPPPPPEKKKKPQVVGTPPPRSNKLVFVEHRLDRIEKWREETLEKHLKHTEQQVDEDFRQQREIMRNSFLETIEKGIRDRSRTDKLKDIGTPVPNEALIGFMVSKAVGDGPFGENLRMYYSEVLRNYLPINMLGMYRGGEIGNDWSKAVDISELGTKPEELVLINKKKRENCQKIYFDQLEGAARDEVHLRFLQELAENQRVTIPLTIIHDLLKEMLPIVEGIHSLYLTYKQPEHPVVHEVKKDIARYKNRMRMYDNM